MAQLDDDIPWEETPVNTGTVPVIPAGVYVATCTKNSIESTKDKSGRMLVCTFQVTRGDFAGVPITHRFNIRNANPKAVAIGVGQLKAFVLAVTGTEERPSDTEILNDIECEIKVVVKPASQDGQYAEGNEIKAFGGIGQLSAKAAAPVQEKPAPVQPAPKAAQQFAPATPAPAIPKRNPLAGPRPGAAQA